MAHISFHSVLPEIAEQETRSTTLLKEHKGLPAGDYGFMEFYCEDSKCDCRNVYIHVVSPKFPGALAIISFGWESLDFYKKWMGATRVDSIIKDFKGPSLALLGIQSRYASALLSIFKDVVNSDKDYCKRLESHYHQFKSEIKAKKQVIRGLKIGRNDGCSCGSGLKYKKCCGK